jgi:RNA polymerase sigma-70 factor (sigma-E family)
MSSPDGFDAYVRANWVRLVRTAVFLGCAPADAEDVVQSALVRCLRAWDRVDAASDREAYIYRVLVNTLRKSRARFWVREIPSGLSDDGSGDGNDPLTGAMERRALQSALLQLSEDQRRVLVLRFYVDLSEQQVATVMKIPVGTVKSRTARALRRMYELLDEPNRVH